MNILCILSLMVGWLLGTPSLAQATSGLIMPALWVMAFAAGAVMGAEGALQVAFSRMGLRILLLPAMIAVCSVLAGGTMGMILGIEPGASLAASAGFGWYSISAVIVGQIGSTEHAMLCFIVNLVREVAAFVIIPVLAERVGAFEAIAPAGATAMDTALPILTRSAGSVAAVAAVITGFVLSVSVPVLVGFFYTLF